jgi:hypothetical protein
MCIYNIHTEPTRKTRSRRRSRRENESEGEFHEIRKNAVYFEILCTSSIICELCLCGTLVRERTSDSLSRVFGEKFGCVCEPRGTAEIEFSIEQAD